MKSLPFDPKSWLVAIVESSDDAIVSKDLNGIITSWNSAAERIFGYTADEIVGQSILTLIPSDRRSEEELILAMVQRGERIRHYDTIRRCKDGRMLHVSLTISPIRNEDGKIFGVSKIARDITERKIAQDTQLLLLRELNHRSKNILAVADAILRQTAKNSEPSELVARVSRRLHALAVNQDLLIARNWRGAALADIVQSQIAALLEDFTSRVRIEGPPLLVAPAAAQALSMAIYELAANALKYGALSTPAGRIEVKWNISEVDGGRKFSMSWQESGGPPVLAPKTAGFGQSIIMDMVARSLDGRASLNFNRPGVSWEIVAPESVLIEEPPDVVSDLTG
jgi:PAS domain S-box-containing protein